MKKHAVVFKFELRFKEKKKFNKTNKRKKLITKLFLIKNQLTLERYLNCAIPEVGESKTITSTLGRLSSNKMEKIRLIIIE